MRTKVPASGGNPAELDSTLTSRRTVREFSRAPVPFRDLAAIVRGTWGRTGRHDGGLLAPDDEDEPLGRVAPPDRVLRARLEREGLSPGLYHYDVGADELRRLRRGDFRAAAVRAASDQRWVGRAGFLCVMTAVFSRSLWKYQAENAYRILWLDAGHLAQTFCLLATARGLGPFTTAAIQDSFLEELIGLDGIGEFPVYLCGAGVASRRSPRNASKPRSRPPRRTPR